MKIERVSRSAIAALTLCAGMSLSATALAQVSVQEVPREMDASNQAAWWRPLAVNGSTTYAAFNAPAPTANQHYVKVGKQVAGGAWVFGVLRNADGTEWIHTDDIGHDQPTVAIDGDGFIHVWVDHHNDNWRYFRSTVAGDVTTLRRVSSGTTAMPDSGLFTYIVADTAPNGDIYLIARNRGGGLTGRGQLYHWQDNLDSWRKLADFANQSGAVVYPDDVTVDSTGDVHLIWEWAYGYPRGHRHYGSYLRYEQSSGRFRTANGVAVNTPVTLSTPALFYQPLGPGESFNDSDSGIGVQSAKLALDSLRRPSVVYRYRTDGGSNTLDYDVYRIRWNGSAWVDRVKVYTANNDVPAALGHTHNGTRVRAYFATIGAGVMAAENTQNWLPRALAPAEPIQRISVVPRSGSEDVVYGAAPTEIDPNRGRLYLLDVGNALP